MKLLSFNIRCANDPDGHSIAERASRVSAVLKAYAPDIVGFQEYHTRWEDAWPQVEDPAYGQLKVDRGDGEGLVLWWRKAAFQVLEQGHFWFADDPRIPSTDWDEKYHKPRICAYLVLKEIKTGKVFTYMNVHYGFGAEGHMKNAKLLKDWAQKLGHPAIVAGDFNMTPDTPGYKAMAEAFTDANRATDGLTDYTYHGYGFSRFPPSQLDYCFVTDGVTPHSFAILKDTFEGKYPSDHYPIAVELSL